MQKYAMLQKTLNPKTLLRNNKALRCGALCLALSFSLSACSSTPKPRPSAYSFAANAGANTALDGWFKARDAEDAAQPTKHVLLDDATEEQRFAAAEIAYFEGDIEHAAKLFMQLLEQNPAHPLNRFGAARLYAMRHQVVDFNEKIRPLLAKLRFADLAPLTRVHVSQIGQSVVYNDWKISDAARPFAADAVGFPNEWTTSPSLSNWRLSDFDQAFLPETEDALREEYLSPSIAEDAPINYVKSRHFSAAGVNLSPNFERSGIYYMETFARVEPREGDGSNSEARDFLLYADFSAAAKIWIDGKLVMTRDEKDYRGGERLRRIRLSPGEHRILVKMAYQKSYRDGFDLTLIADDATPLGGSGLSFEAKPRANPDGAQKEGSITLLGEQKMLADLDPTRIAPDAVTKADDISLYLAANAAILNLEAQDFDAAWGALMERHPKFAVGYMLRAQQLRTLWEVPSRIRNARSMADLRRAAQLAPDNLSNNLLLGKRLREQGKSDAELQDLLRKNRDAAFTQSGELRNIEPLHEWADFLEDQDWSESAEQAWKRVLDAAPTECGAAHSLQYLYNQRDFFPTLAEITPAHAKCPTLLNTFARNRKDQAEVRLKLARQDALRYPYRASSQERYSAELIAQGQPDKARQVLVAARDRMPWDVNLWYELAKIALADEGMDAARALIEGGIDQHESSAWLQWRLSMLENKVPLADLMHDGLKIAREDVARGEAETSGDEAYYALDFAARKYFEDGSSVTLTHNVIRVMTKGGIDRFGEFETPNGAELVLARTIKKDGSVRIPEQMSGKSTLSMPGLAPGDFVEMAYIQYSSASALSKTRQRGIRFFFRMAHISSQHSEYIIVNPRGDFQRMNDAPEPKSIQTSEGPAVQFLRTDSPRPRREPSQVAGDEYLPWIQMHREGTTTSDFEASRRNISEQIRDSLKMSEPLRQQIAEWRKGLKPGSEEEVKELFYRVSSWIADPTLTQYNTDATHVLLEHDGNPLLLLKAAYDQAGIPAEIYFARSKFQSPHEDLIGEFAKYSSPLMKVQMPDKTHAWVSPDSPDAMFNSPGNTLIGQMAVCVSCDEAHREVVAPQNPRPINRHVAVDGKVNAQGTLDATMTITYRGALAALVRQVLRKNADPSSRKKFADVSVASLISGATLQSFEFDGLDKRDEDLLLRAKFTRKNFARPYGANTLQIQSKLFDENIAGQYAELSQRETPLFVPYSRDYGYTLKVDFPAGSQLALQSQAGSWEYNTEFGEFSRSVNIDGQTLTLNSSIDIPVQRVAPETYTKFRSWARNLDRSALLFLRVSQNN
ncbi:tetratricopeptide repeat protein [Bradymonas sediminis]|uniref:Uncharacterized protein n=1 Tax=Bradymonas sediminis TaxID=1548548 RepID=A0A2Z4FNR7_9DELT|nr:tetratricopeptide repeat protein [Bradymonas sediminis]AWV90647.1 hypothetical protein DN745_15475 [Bradymonas sediminis]TDP62350.1 hypothetical protein DFR33_11313 [Bradymonas sediminis]